MGGNAYMVSVAKPERDRYGDLRAEQYSTAASRHGERLSLPKQRWTSM